MHREDHLKWIAVFGKDPDRVEGYSDSTEIRTAYRLDQFYRWVWDEQGYTTNITTDHADQYFRELAAGDLSNTHKNNVVSSLKRLFKWQAHERGGEEWEPDFRFQTSHNPTQPKDFFTREERAKLREAALEYGPVPAYNDLSPRERSQWKAHLSQRFEKPKSEVTPADWDRANG
ncbi:site-specific integrase, partial [Haloferax profundi]|uniref:site-specific integrase n=1 Tax=Haloferax profundi TaxID=1544718 RepID=UPI000AC15CF1